MGAGTAYLALRYAVGSLHPIRPRRRLSQHTRSGPPLPAGTHGEYHLPVQPGSPAGALAPAGVPRCKKNLASRSPSTYELRRDEGTQRWSDGGVSARMEAKGTWSSLPAPEPYRARRGYAISSRGNPAVMQTRQETGWAPPIPAAAQVAAAASRPTVRLVPPRPRRRWSSYSRPTATGSSGPTTATAPSTPSTSPPRSTAGSTTTWSSSAGWTPRPRPC